MLLKRFVKFRRILVADEARLRCDMGDSSVETVVKFRMGVWKQHCFYCSQGKHLKCLMSNFSSFTFVETENGTLFQTDSEKHSPWRQASTWRCTILASLKFYCPHPDSLRLVILWSGSLLKWCQLPSCYHGFPLSPLSRSIKHKLTHAVKDKVCVFGAWFVLSGIMWAKWVN